MDEMINQLLAVAEGLLLLGTTWFIWFISGVANNLFSDKKWSWKRTGEDILKTFLMVVATLAWVVVINLLDRYTSSLGIDISELLDGASVVGLITIITGGAGIYAYKGFRNIIKFFIKDHTDLEKIMDGVSVPEEITKEQYKEVAEPAKQVINGIYQYLTTPKDSVEYHKKWEQEGGRGAAYSVPISSYDAFRAAVVGKGFDIDGAWGYQCLTAGHYVLMNDGSYKAIEDIEEGELVAGGKNVLQNTPRLAQVMKVHTRLGWFTCTLDHKCVLEDGTIKEAKDLEKGDKIALNLSCPEEPRYTLTHDELLYLGFWLGDGTKKYRWANTQKPEIFVTVGTPLKEEFLEGLNLNLVKRIHSNGRAHTYKLINRDHPVLMEVIHSLSGKELPRVFTPEQYKYIVEGYIRADGTTHHDGWVATSVDKSLLVGIQFACLVNGTRAILSLPHQREATNLCEHPRPYWTLHINPNQPISNHVLSTEILDDEEEVYVLNLDGDHIYTADNMKQHNCWDGAGLLWQQVGMWLQTGNGCAYGCWTLKRSVNAGTKFDLITDKYQVKRGDVVVFGGGEFGHIAFADEDYNGGGYMRILGQNQGGTPYAQGGSSFNTINMSMANFLGAFRLKAWAKEDTKPAEEIKPTPTPTEPVTSQTFKKGDFVKLKQLVDIHGTKLMDLDPKYLVIEPSPKTQTALLQSSDGDIYARVSYSNMIKV